MAHVFSPGQLGSQHSPAPAVTSSSASNSTSMHTLSSALQSKVLRDFAASGIAVAIANVATNPIEVCKTRMMLQQKAAAASLAAPSNPLTQHPAAAAAALPRRGLLATGVDIWQLEGPKAFTRGVQASALRGITFGGIRLGMYGPIKDLMVGSSNSTSSSSSSSGSGAVQPQLSFGQKLLAGSISGGVGAYLTNPFELIKTRCQAAGAGGQGPMAVVRTVVQQQGVAGLWQGATPGVLRSTMLNAAMCATYDEAKNQVFHLTGWRKEGLANTLTASMASGLVTTTVINPVDVVRAYMQTGRSGGASTAAVTATIWRQEGLAAFMKGWSAAYMRTGPQCVMIFLTSEALRPLFGLKQIA